MSLADDLLVLARAQGKCLADQDWDGFAGLAAERESLTARLLPQIKGRAELRATLAQVAELDALHETLLTAAHEDLEHEWHQMQPQQTAVLAYFQGEKTPPGEARFFDSRD